MAVVSRLRFTGTLVLTPQRFVTRRFFVLTTVYCLLSTDFNVRQLVGNERAKEILRRMLAQGRVPGALLFAGEEGLGKTALRAGAGARAELPLDGAAKRRAAYAPRARASGKFSTRPPTSATSIRRSSGASTRTWGSCIPYNRNILIDAVRDLERESNFRPVEGAARVFVVENAESLSESASNALLKTLEEAAADPAHHPHHFAPCRACSRPSARAARPCASPRSRPKSWKTILVEEGKRAGEEARLAAQLASGQARRRARAQPRHLPRAARSDVRRGRGARLGAATACGSCARPRRWATRRIRTSTSRAWTRLRYSCAISGCSRSGAAGRWSTRPARTSGALRRRRPAPRAPPLAHTHRRAARPTRRQRQPPRRHRRPLPLDVRRLSERPEKEKSRRRKGPALPSGRVKLAPRPT